MDIQEREKLAGYLQEKLHNYCSGYMFSPEDVLDCINNFFKVYDLIKKRDEIQKQIDELEEK